MAFSAGNRIGLTRYRVRSGVAGLSSTGVIAWRSPLIRPLLDHPAVDPARVFVAGHSAGGKAAPRVAAAEGTGPSTPAEYETLQHVDPAVLADIAQWLAPGEDEKTVR